MQFCIFCLCLACASVIWVISTTAFMSLASVLILTSMGGIQEVPQTLQYIKPIGDCVVFLSVD